MRRILVGSLVLLTMAVASVAPANAGGLGGNTVIKKKTLFSKTVTTTVYTANLTSSLNNFANASGTATYTVTTVALTILGHTSTSTCTTLVVNASGLNSVNNNNVVDGDTVTFYDNAGDILGYGVISGGVATLNLSSSQGATIPDLSSSGIYIIKTNGNGNHIVDGNFSQTSQTVTRCGGTTTTTTSN